MSEVLNVWTEEQFWLFVGARMKRNRKAQDRQEEESESGDGGKSDGVDWNNGENW